MIYDLPDLQREAFLLGVLPVLQMSPPASVVIAESSSAERYRQKLDALGFSRKGLTRLGPSWFFNSHGFHLSYFKHSTFS